MTSRIWVSRAVLLGAVAGSMWAANVDFSSGPVQVIAGNDPIERNVVQMILSEVEARYQKRWIGGQAPGGGGSKVEFVIDSRLNLGREGYRMAAKDNAVRISANTPVGLMRGAAGLLDVLQDAPLRIPEGDRTETTKSKFRGLSGFADTGGAAAGATSLCDQGAAERTAAFEKYVRYMARHRFNYVVIRPCETDSAVRYRYLPEIERSSNESKAKAQAAANSINVWIHYARAWGLDVFLSRNEITYPDELLAKYPNLRATSPPDADRVYRPPTAGGADTLYNQFGRKPNLCISEAKTWELVEAKERELAELLPDLAGLSMSTNGTESDIFYCNCDRCRRLSKSQRVELLARHVTHGLDLGSPGKKLILTPYMGAWKNLLEPEVYIPLADRLPSSVIINTGAQYGDTYIFNSLNPLVGAFPRNDVIFGFDPAGEYFGGFFGVQSTISRYMGERARAYHDRGVSNISFRNIQYHTDFSELDWYVGSELAWNPQQDVEKLRNDWARREFGAEAGPKVLDLLDLGFDVMRKSLYADGINFTNWGLFIENISRTRHIMMDRSAKLADHGMERIAPTASNIARMMGEKEEAFQLAEQGVMKVDELRGKISPAQLQGLRASFILATELARVYRPELEVIMRYLQWEGTLSDVDRERLRKPLLDAVAQTRSAVKTAQMNLATIDARKMCQDLGLDWVTFKSNKGLYSADPSVTSMDRNLSLPYVLQLVDDVEKRMQYVPASVFGYY